MYIYVYRAIRKDLDLGFSCSLKGEILGLRFSRVLVVELNLLDVIRFQIQSDVQLRNSTQ